MMKVKVLLMSVIVTLALVGCQDDVLNGDQNVITGKPGMLTLNIKSSKIKTKAMGNPTADNEKVINDFTVFVLRSDGSSDVLPVYYSTFAGNDVVDIQITDAAERVMVVANLGDPSDNQSVLGDILTNQSGNIEAKLNDAVLDLNGSGSGSYLSPQVSGNLVQTGSASIIWVSGNASALATVNLQFVAARVSIEEIKLFGEVTDNASASTSDDRGKAIKAAGIENIAISRVFMLNAPSTTHLFPYNAGAQWPNALFTGNPKFYEGYSSGFSDGTYYPTVSGSEIYPFNSGDGMLVEDIVSEVPNISAEYPYFYVWENADNGSKTSGITLAVIQCYVTVSPEVDPSIATSGPRYYTVVLNNAVNSQTSKDGKTYPNYSTKRGVHYRIKVDITGLGQEDPYTPSLLKPLTLTISQTPWDEENIGW